jgi:photosystem II stability/assembly factor-like uncharacterized protein
MRARSVRWHTSVRYLTLFLNLLASPLSAGSGRWTGIGPEGGPVTSISVDPTNPSVLYAGTPGAGIFKSLDAGASWKTSNGGLSNLYIFSVAIDPITPSTLYASTYGDRLVKSTDGGASWRPAVEGLPGSVVPAILVDPKKPNTIYAAIDAAASGGSVYKSDDGASSWKVTGLVGPNIDLLAFDPFNSAVLYAGGGVSNLGIFKSTDAGASWVSVDEGLTARGISSLVADPSTLGTLYAATFSPTALFKTTDAAAHWTRIGATLPQPERFSGAVVAVDPRNASVVHVGYFSGDGIFRSADGGSTWSPVIAGLDDALVVALSFNPLSSKVYAGTTAGVFDKPSSGSTWTPRKHGLTNAQIVSLALDGSTVYAAAQYRVGVQKSGDGGASWATLRTGLPSRLIERIAIAPRNPSVLYAASSIDGVFKTADAGEHWSRLNLGESEPYIGALAIDPIQPATLFAGGYRGLFKSEDGGATWRHLTGYTGSDVFAIAVDPTRPSTVYAATYSPSGANLSRSIDGGDTWASASEGLAIDVAVLTIDPQSPSTLYAGSRNRGGVAKSADAGAHWTASGFGLPNAGISGLIVDPRNSAVVYASTGFDLTGRGVYRSTDAGSSWSAFNDGLTNVEVLDLAFDPAGRTLYAGTGGGGVFQLTLSSTAPCVSGAGSLCLNGGRFAVRAEWRVTSQGTGGVATAVPLTSDTGYFWFFTASNIELVVKVVDGRSFNDKFWVFYGALSDVDYTITVTDTQTGAIRTYHNPPGQLASVADTSAF